MANSLHSLRLPNLGGQQMILGHEIYLEEGKRSRSSLRQQADDQSLRCKKVIGLESSDESSKTTASPRPCIRLRQFVRRALCYRRHGLTDRQSPPPFSRLTHRFLERLSALKVIVC